ncbi:hypothetical protein LEP1GSC038_0494 [Leptospira weilii str. 2006001855]|uniref:Uncharacterized protein n=2 Tax=Leptospira weilii TaxID=28184 RepID=M6Q8F0_9LEPT|nr:hypothetical protein LEP1GSC051_4388 [Leptospira sp. P2653]EMM71655.1 hypothetical protein LEP1GSC038_0494 [Leptospira weilii str. 2006001855]EMN91579.1 hypothetical protein LEP1GSC108_4088 [Leptospira weilii str. UI 13098]
MNFFIDFCGLESMPEDQKIALSAIEANRVFEKLILYPLH